jgi:hypothetical protein
LHPIGKHNDEIDCEILPTKAVERSMNFGMMRLYIRALVQVLSLIVRCKETSDKDCSDEESRHDEQDIECPENKEGERKSA